VRRRIVQALKAARPLGIRLALDAPLERRAIADGSGDLLDALICALQAAWAATRPDYGIPASAPPGEGWIVTA
jgi:hypothetical protein